MLGRLRVIAVLLAVLAVGTACEKSESKTVDDPKRVLLVYVGADSNLSGMEKGKIEAIQKGWTGKSTDRIIAYIDNSKEGAALYELSVPVHQQPRLIESYGKENSASPAVLGRVIGDVTGMFPADNYGMLIFSHASGWLPNGALQNPRIRSEAGNDCITNDKNASKNTRYGFDSRTIIYDGNSQMELADFASAIPTGVFDYIVFETCFMAGIEVAYELRDKAEYLFVSSAEIVHPGFEPAYAKAIPRLLAGDLEAFGQCVFDAVLGYNDGDVRKSATYSIIRTAGLEQLASFVRDNCDLEREVRISGIQHFDRNAYRLFFDFEDYYGRLLDSDADRLLLAGLINKCVSWKAATPEFMTQSSGYNGFKVEKHSGVTVYIPQEDFSNLNDAYTGLEWAKKIGM